MIRCFERRYRHQHAYRNLHEHERRPPRPFARLAAGLLIAAASVATVAGAQPAAANGAPDLRFVCGGEVEARVWAEWDHRVRPYIDIQLLRERLHGQGDAYALYDVESLTQNVAGMAGRCQRVDRLRQIAALLNQAYGNLEDSVALLHGSSAGPRWVCRGGRICNARNRLLYREILLNSAQFLGLALRVANALAAAAQREPATAAQGAAQDADSLTLADREFIDATTRIAAAHLLRWHSAATERRLKRAILTRAPEMAVASTELLFTDFDLWRVTMYAELAGLLHWRAVRDPGAPPVAGDDERQRMGHDFAVLLDFLAARLSYRRDSRSRVGDAAQADIDRGYWRLLKESRYAGYLQEAKPLECLPVPDAEGESGRLRAAVRIPPEAVPPHAEVGWDISHARRLVPALDALERHRQAILGIYRIDESRLPPPWLAAAFANTLLATVWNGDGGAPLFANYWSGLNGWYRVGWDDGTGKCREGYPPYGMSDAFVTGGYLAWSRYQPALGALGRRLYDILEAPGAADSPFVQRFYPSMSSRETPGRRALARFTFLASMVATGH